MKLIKEYNEIINKIVFNFVKRLYIEEWEEETPTIYDFEIISYKWISWWPVEIWNNYLSLDDVLICEANEFSPGWLIKYNDICLSLSYKDLKPECNYYNYAKYNLNPKKIN
jgi:hypothetical protein